MKKIKKIFFYAAGIPCLLFISYLFFEPFFLEIRHYTASNKKIPESFDGKKIIFISDIHHGLLFSQNRVRKLVEKVNSLNPDIIVLGGDYVSRDVKYIDPVFAELKNLRAGIGIYAVLGNHDNYESGELTIQKMKQSGFNVLNNAAEWIKLGNQKIRIGGVRDMWTEFPDINPTIKDTFREDYVILVSHIPDYSERLPENKIDLMLSGHTHGGQITFFGLWAPFTSSDFGQKYRRGFIKKGDTQMIVSSGVGTIVLPMRFFARPEIAVITLKSQSN